MKFSQLFLRKITEIGTIRYQILRLKYNKFDFGWRAEAPPQTPLGSLQRSPRPPNLFKGSYRPRPRWGAYSAPQAP